MTETAPRIVIPFIPSLFHISLVKIAIRLYSDFDIDVWKILLEEKLNEKASRKTRKKKRTSQEVQEVNEAREKLLTVPEHLRQHVLEAIMSLDSAVSQWLIEHSYVQNFQHIAVKFRWRPDGTIDRIKTVKKMLRNREINIRLRFDLACSYFLEKYIQSLWREMLALGKGENFVTSFNPVSYFWVRYLFNKSQIPWVLAVRDYLELPENCDKFPIPRLSAFLPFLEPIEREKFLPCLKKITTDDFRFCLYGVTKEEEMQILQKSTERLLALYLDWPLQNLFLETAKKLWSFMKFEDFRITLHAIYFYSQTRYDFDYYKLFVDFYSESPNHLKEQIKSCQAFSIRMYVCMKEMKKRKKAEPKNLSNSKKKKDNTDEQKWIRKNGRLQPVPKIS